MMRLGLILGDSLFPNHTLRADSYVMIEDLELCTHFKYHKHKIILFLSAMRSHAQNLNCSYYKLDNQNFFDKLREEIQKKKATTLVLYEVHDKFFRNKIKEFTTQQNIDIEIVPSQSFLTSTQDFIEWKKGKKKIMQKFYEWQRKRLNILTDDNQNPIGGKWSFDEDNRKKLPKDMSPPKLPLIKHSKIVKEVKDLVDTQFKDHPGKTDNFWLPTTREQAIVWIEDFFIHRFANFGPYEDAFEPHEQFLFHSVLSPLLNCGLITPKELVEKALAYDVPISSKEGFIRQVIGWREYIKGMYETTDFKKNFFNNQNKLSKKWYEGSTGIPPLDDAIQQTIEIGYAHHIQRLMIIGNIMLLCDIHPDEVYQWFMELYVDSADWVMVPNVYGMSQFADGGSFATKPYIAGSNYLRKMSHYPRGDWCDIVDGLYWRFIQKHKTIFAKNHRMSMMVKLLEKKDYSKKIAAANNFIKKVTS